MCSQLQSPRNDIFSRQAGRTHACRGEGWLTLFGTHWSLKTLTSMMHTDENSQPSSRLMTLMADKNVWKTGGNSMDVMEAYCVMICCYEKGKGKKKTPGRGKKKRESGTQNNPREQRGTRATNTHTHKHTREHDAVT